MKFIKVMVGLGLIPLCIFIGGYIPIGDGNAAIIGGIIGCILCFIVISYGSRGKRAFWTRSNSLEEQHQVNNNVNKQAIDNTLRGVQEAHLLDEMLLPRHRTR